MARTTTSGDHADSGKREAILEAALDLFGERGFHGTAVPLVAERAKVGAGTIYRYFESKEQLVNALYQHEKRAMLDALLADFPFDRPPRDQFRTFFHRMASYAKVRPRAVRFMELHHHAPYLDETSRHLEEHGNQLIEAAVRAAIEQEVMKNLPPILLVAVVWGVFLGLLRGWTEGRFELDETTIGQAEQCCWEAIRR
ncbi:MAG: TetR family transcriptional regulator [Myxococcota bacterium]|nr:TetR family transcriptional regulator [Myxococcota bacterium]